MTLTDDDHRVARIVSNLEKRVRDLEETSRSGGAANPLITVSDGIGVGDRVDSVRARQIGTLEYGNPDTGLGVDAYGGYQ